MPELMGIGQAKCEALRVVTGETVRPGGYRLTDQAINFCGLKAGSHLLDVGCGTGASVEYLIKKYQLAAVGIDPSDRMLELGIRRCAWLPIKKGCAESVSFAKNSMDALLAECSLSDFSDLGQALQEFSRVLKSDGWLIVSDLYLRSMPGPAEGMGSRQNEIESAPTVPSGLMKKETIIMFLTVAGYDVILWEDHTDKLKQLSAEIIFKYGSLTEFWKNACQGCQSRCTELPQDLRLGYYLLIAKKNSRNGVDSIA
ncbi:class I SAM-dependent methyltransferase [Dehalobacter sp. DCM]|uniref:DVU_1556 family methyltransferase n=1 Tax=Dehalobacter sp. DCM TaxID=2907827 RepID=UPI003081FA4F|nr:class I SAM-dependent methyltransferase [Dehalobacter sp. DCM]